MSIVLMGSTSGSITLSEPAVAGSNTISLPAVTGTMVVAGQNSAITASTAVASTSGTSIDFTSIPTWVKRVTVMFNAVSFNATTTPIVQLGDSGGIENTGYSGVAGTISTTANTTNGQSSTTSGILLYSGTIAAAEFVTGSLTISLLGSNAWVFSGNVFSGGRATTLSGAKTLTDTLTQVRITTTGGTDTFDAGSINILYE